MLPILSNLTLTNTLQTKKCGNFLKYPRICNIYTDIPAWLCVECRVLNCFTLSSGIYFAFVFNVMTVTSFVFHSVL